MTLVTQKADESDCGERHPLDPEPGGVDAARPDRHVLVAGEGRVLRGQGGLSCCSKAEVNIDILQLVLGMFCSVIGGESNVILRPRRQSYD